MTIEALPGMSVELDQAVLLANIAPGPLQSLLTFTVSVDLTQCTVALSVTLVGVLLIHWALLVRFMFTGVHLLLVLRAQTLAQGSYAASASVSKASAYTIAAARGWCRIALECGQYLQTGRI